MHIKMKHQIYTKDFSSKEIFEEYIQKKINQIEESLHDFIKIKNDDFEDTYNSRALTEYEDQADEIESHFKNLIEELKSMKGNLR